MMSPVDLLYYQFFFLQKKRRSNLFNGHEFFAQSSRPKIDG